MKLIFFFKIIFCLISIFSREKPELKLENRGCSNAGGEVYKSFLISRKLAKPILKILKMIRIYNWESSIYSYTEYLFLNTRAKVLQGIKKTVHI